MRLSTRSVKVPRLMKPGVRNMVMIAVARKSWLTRLSRMPAEKPSLESTKENSLA